MTGSRILLISKSPLFVEAIKQLLRTANIVIDTTVRHTEEAWPLLKTEKFTSIVMDFDDPSITESEFISRLYRQTSTQRVILLESGDNRMIVHRREISDHATPSDLIFALQDAPANLEASNYLN